MGGEGEECRLWESGTLEGGPEAGSRAWRKTQRAPRAWWAASWGTANTQVEETTVYVWVTDDLSGGPMSCSPLGSAPGEARGSRDSKGHWSHRHSPLATGGGRTFRNLPATTTQPPAKRQGNRLGESCQESDLLPCVLETRSAADSAPWRQRTWLCHLVAEGRRERAGGRRRG